MTMQELFVEHPASMGETYLEHMRKALWFASQLFACAVMCLVHAVVPGCFTTSASRRVKDLVLHMQRLPVPPAPTAQGAALSQRAS